MIRSRATFRRFPLLSLVVSCLLGVVVAPPAFADGPGSGSPWIVSLGDSYISGEAGRWAGNTNNGEQLIDALGPTAYFDNPSHTAEQITRCHRSRSAEVYIGGGVNGYNLACSGAQTNTGTDGNGNFKPGIDFYSNGAQQGQALMLKTFAASHNIKMIALSIGGNNFHFASVVQQCVQDFLLSPSWLQDHCDDDSSVNANFTAANITATRTAIIQALRNIRQAMTDAGYSSSSYTILVQDYPLPIPAGADFRYAQTGYTRQSVGGCGFWNADADWAGTTMLPLINRTVAEAVTDSGLTNTVTMHLADAFGSRRLCQNTVGLLEEKGLSSWTAPGAADQSEWINQIRVVTTIGTDFYIQESMHPNYWGQLALRNCLRQAYNDGTPHGGTCTRTASGTNDKGEPLMSLN